MYELNKYCFAYDYSSFLNINQNQIKSIDM